METQAYSWDPIASTRQRWLHRQRYKKQPLWINNKHWSAFLVNRLLSIRVRSTSSRHCTKRNYSTNFKRKVSNRQNRHMDQRKSKVQQLQWQTKSRLWESKGTALLPGSPMEWAARVKPAKCSQQGRVWPDLKRVCKKAKSNPCKFKRQLFQAWGHLLLASQQLS